MCYVCIWFTTYLERVQLDLAQFDAKINRTERLETRGKWGIQAIIPIVLENKRLWWWYLIGGNVGCTLHRFAWFSSRRRPPEIRSYSGSN